MITFQDHDSATRTGRFLISLFVLTGLLGMGSELFGDENGGKNHGTTVGKVAKNVTGVLTHPQKIPLPEDIPCVEFFRNPKFPDEPPEVHSPLVRYVINHFDGWQAFLQDFGSRDADPVTVKWKNPGAQNFDPRGCPEGYEACRKRVLELLKSTQEPKLPPLARDQSIPEWPRFGYKSDVPFKIDRPQNEEGTDELGLPLPKPTNELCPPQPKPLDDEPCLPLPK